MVWDVWRNVGLVCYMEEMDDRWYWDLHSSISDSQMGDNKCMLFHFFDMCKNRRVCISKIDYKSNIVAKMKEMSLLMLKER